MKTVQAFEGNLELNSTLFYAYEKAKKTGNRYIDFNDIIWEQDIEAIVTECKKAGLDYITISSTQSGIMETLAMFQQLGCKVGTMMQVKSSYIDFMTGETKDIPAIAVKL